MKKTPLRYPGGKSRFVKIFDNFIDINCYNKFCEPFAGGASISLYIQQKYNIEEIWLNDLYYSLYNFWINLRDNSEELISKIWHYKSDAIPSDNLREIKKKIFSFQKVKKISCENDLEKDFYETIENNKKMFKKFKKEINEEKNLVLRAAQFYVLNIYVVS